MSVVFAPLLPWPVVLGLAALAVIAAALALWRGLGVLRAFAFAALLAALAGPSLEQEDRTALADVMIAVVDDSASQALPGRGAQVAEALAHLRAEAARLGAELHEVTVGDAEGGTLAMAALRDALAEVPLGRLSGVVVITDGRVADAALAPDLPAPLHQLTTGRAGDWDRRLVVESAPSFAILGEEIELRLRIEDQGAAPDSGTAELLLSIDGEAPRRVSVPVNTEMALPLTLPHGGINVVHLSTPQADGELTTRNNASALRINGVRDRLRVMLVSGEPHAGERTWRNLLKSDPSVDLVHFTILRPPEKNDGVPVNELALIAFPTRELFLDKVDEFDLIVFDRYQLRGLLPQVYLQNVAAYVERGGAVLVSAGPEYAGAVSLARSPLGQVLPGVPTGLVVDEGFLPEVTELGARHPVTQGLPGPWGRWLRQVDLAEVAGDIVMAGANGRPLLALDRVGEGRVAVLASDHAWLWHRGYEGGGPQAELLRRLAHWMMKEPELEEDALVALGTGAGLRIERRALEGEVGAASVTGPSGAVTEVPLAEVAPGRFVAEVQAPDMGLYRVTEGELSAVAVVGPAAPVEFEQTIATSAPLAEAMAARRGGAIAVEDGLPRVRAVRDGRVAAGPGWLGVTPRGAYETLALTVRPILPPWGWLMLAGCLVLAAWLWEGRRGA